MPRSRNSPSVTDGRGPRRRFDVGSPWILLLATAFLVAPFAFGVYVGLTAQATIDDLRAQNRQLALQGSAHREAAARVNGQLPTLLEKVEELAERIGMDQVARASVDSLPDDAKQTVPGRLDSDELDDVNAVFDSLRDLLESLQDTLQVVTLGVAHREALAEATPTIWPADGWISAGYGYRDDPFTGQRDFHPAVDISTRKGQPVYATATGRVTRASRNGAYGNLVEIDHGFGLTTRYGHLSEFVVATGDTVVRGDVIGSVGATGRATGHHVHYEVRANGRALNPRKLLSGPPSVATD